MAGARNRHNRIASRVLVLLGSALEGRPCEPCNSDTKIRIRLPTQTRFPYPDASVICHSNPEEDPFQDQPVIVIEVLSQRTRRIDEQEKKDAYLTIASLNAYALVEQETPRIVIYRRSQQGFLREAYESLDDVIQRPEIGAELDLRRLYAGIEFGPEVETEESRWVAVVDPGCGSETAAAILETSLRSLISRFHARSLRHSAHWPVSLGQLLRRNPPVHRSAARQ